MAKILDNSQQNNVSLQRRMPVETTSSAVLETKTGEAVTFQYFNNGVLTTDAGEAAGTLVVFKLADKNIKSELGDVIGHSKDTSFSFNLGAALNSIKKFDGRLAQAYETGFTLEQKALKLTENFKQGEYTLDHRNGTGYGIKATTAAADAADYIVEAAASSGGGGGGSDEIEGKTADGTAVTSNPIDIGAEVVDATALPSVTVGNKERVTVDENQRVNVNIAHPLNDEMEKATPFTVSASGTTTVMTGAGRLFDVQVLGGVAGDVVVYDSTTASGTEIVPNHTAQAGKLISSERGISITNGVTFDLSSATVITGSYLLD